MNQVDEFTLRTAGMNEVDALGLAREVANQLSLRLPQLPNQLRIDEIKIQLGETNLARPESLASHITDHILRQINQAIS